MAERAQDRQLAAGDQACPGYSGHHFQRSATCCISDRGAAADRAVCRDCGRASISFIVCDGFLGHGVSGDHPEDPETREDRATPLAWINTQLDFPIRSIPINNAGHSYINYKDSRVVGYEDQVKTDKDRKARSAMIENGKLAPEVFDKAFSETPKAFYPQAEKDLDACLETIGKLDAFCDEKLEDDSPGFGKIKTALTEVRQVVHQLLEKKREKEPDPVEAAPVEEAATGRGRRPKAARKARRSSRRALVLRWSASLPTAGRLSAASLRRRRFCASGSRSVPRLIYCCAGCAGASCAARRAWWTVRCSKRRRRSFASRSSGWRWPRNGPSCSKPANRRWRSPAAARGSICSGCRWRRVPRWARSTCPSLPRSSRSCARC